jgi:hypothetical protein
MTRDQAVTLILNRVGQRGGAFGAADAILGGQIVTEMQQQQDELEKSDLGTMPWFLSQEYTNAAFKTAIGVDTVAHPTGFLREWDDVRVAMFYQDTSVSGDQWIPIAKEDYDVLKTELGDQVPGKPQGYCWVGENFRFFPTPDAEYPLKLLAYIGDTVLTTNIENKWLKYAGRVLIGKTGEVIASLGVRDKDAIAYFVDMAAKGLAGLIRDNVARAEAGRSRQMGED